MKLSDDGRAHLARLTDGADLDLLSPVDRDVLVRYCESYARWEAAEDGVTEFGALVKNQSGFPGENPNIAIALKYSQACSRMEARVKEVLEQLAAAVARSSGGASDGDDEDLDQMLGSGFRGE